MEDSKKIKGSDIDPDLRPLWSPGRFDGLCCPCPEHRPAAMLAFTVLSVCLDLDHDGDLNVAVSANTVTDWSGGDGTGYHAPSLKHNTMIGRLLMHGWLTDNAFEDIPLFGVKDFYDAFPMSFLKSVGLNSMGERRPTH